MTGFFLRLITRHTRHTKMVTADAIRFGDRARLLDFDAAEHPLALQLGGRPDHIGRSRQNRRVGV